MAEKKSLRMLHDRVLVLPDPAKEKTEAGLDLPTQAQERPITGTVISAGPGKDGVPLEVKMGDRVVYGKHAGTPVKVPGDELEYVMMRETEILAVEEQIIVVPSQEEGATTEGE